MAQIWQRGWQNFEKISGDALHFVFSKIRVIFSQVGGKIWRWEWGKPEFYKRYTYIPIPCCLATTHDKFVHELPFNPTCRRNIDVWYWLQIQHLNIKYTNYRTWEKNIQNASVNDTREEYNNIVLEVQGLPCLRQPSEPGNTQIRFRKDSFRPLIASIFHERLFKRNDHHHHQSHHHPRHGHLIEDILHPLPGEGGALHVHLGSQVGGKLLALSLADRLLCLLLCKVKIIW